MEGKGASHGFNPNRLKRVLIPAGLTLMAVGVGGCAKLDQAFAYPDYSGDPGVARVTENYINMAADQARANATPEPTYPSGELSLLPDMRMCDVINPNETVSHVIEQLGAWPEQGTIQGGLVPSVGLYRSGETPIIATIDDVLAGRVSEMNTVDIGDTICISGNPAELQKPLPTPQSSIPSRATRASAGFSPSRGSQAARPMPIRRG